MILEILEALIVVGKLISIIWKCDSCGHQAKIRVTAGCPIDVECSKCGRVERIVV